MTWEPATGYLPGSLDAQVLVLLSNPTTVKQVKSVFKEEFKEPRARIVLICDEDDLNTQSAEHGTGELEKQLFGPWDQGQASSSGEVLDNRCLRDRVMQVISFTATIGAIAVSEKRPMQVKMMPVQPDYWGLSDLVPPERRPHWKEVERQDMATARAHCQVLLFQETCGCNSQWWPRLPHSESSPSSKGKWRKRFRCF